MGTEQQTKRHSPNFVKSNSLGLMSAACAHHNLGNTFLHWEGNSEKMIQLIKMFLNIKCSNADWQTICLRKFYQHQSLQRLLESTGYAKVKRNRDTDSILKIHSDEKDLQESVSKFCPMTGILCNENKIWLAYRPVGRPDTSRSSVDLREVKFDDEHGELVNGVCWMAPITLARETRQFGSLLEVQKSFSKEIVLMLPKLGHKETFNNMYYCLGHKWTERNSKGYFRVPQLHASIFKEWVLK